MKIPKEISPCPIVEALVELRIQPSPETPIDAVFGLVFEKLHSEFPKVVNLPAMNLPEQIREADPNLKYQAHHRLSNDIFSVSVGPRVLTFSCGSPYAGWESFSGVIFKSLDSLLAVEGLIDGVERIGVRFVNFFDSNLGEQINFKLTAPRLAVDGCQFHTTIIVPDSEFSNTIQLANKASVTVNKNKRDGSVVDIDTFCIDPSGKLREDLYGRIERGHDCEKKIFYSLLREDVLSSLNPVY